MCKCQRTVDFILMILLALLEIVTSVIFSIILVYTIQLDSNEEKYKQTIITNLINSPLNLTVDIISVWIIAVFGFHALYFKIIPKLIWYIICALIIPSIFWLLFIIDVLYENGNDMKSIKPSEIKEIYDLKEIAYYISCIKSVFYLVSALLTILERSALVIEIKASPFSCIDESLTEELYNNILRQSKNPEDESLISEYKRLTLSKRKSPLFRSRTEKNFNTLNESGEGDSSIFKANTGSINFNKVVDKNIISKSSKTSKFFV